MVLYASINNRRISLIATRTNTPMIVVAASLILPALIILAVRALA